MSTRGIAGWQAFVHPLTFLVTLALAAVAWGKGPAAERYGELPLHFEINQGQTHEAVRFLSRGPGYRLYLTATEAVLVLAKPSADAAPEKRTTASRATPIVLRMSIEGAEPEPLLSVLEELPGKGNYFIGKDAAKWRTNVPTYAKVRYHEIYPGIDLFYYGNQQQLEYDFVVRPGADPKVISLKFQGAERVDIDALGDLVLHTAGGVIRQRKPAIYQDIDGSRREVAGGYFLKDVQRVGFKVATYDTGQPLVIDPVVSYSTYLGGSASDQGLGSIAVDSMGNAYITGLTQSTDFPTMGMLDTTSNGGTDAFVTKLDPSGSSLVYSAYIGGAGFDFGSAIAVDSAGNAYVSGFTDSSDFPTTAGAFDTTYNGAGDAFALKLNPSGSALVYSTYLGGNDGDFGGHAIAVDASGNAYVAGATRSPNYPTTAGVFQPNLNGPEDAVVTKLDPTGSSLVYSTYLGGNNQLAVAENAFAIALDAAGNAYVTGRTSSNDFPTTPGAVQAAHGGGSHDVFVTKINAAGTGLIFSTYLGGTGFDQGDGIALDAMDNVYVAGEAQSSNFPTTAGGFQPIFGGGAADGFVVKLNPTGTAFVYSTYLGGGGHDRIGFGGGGGGLAIDNAGNVHVTGFTDSTDFPTLNAIQSTLVGVRDAFVTKINPTGTGLVYSTFLGGSSDDAGGGIALDTATTPNAYVVGFTASTDFPTTPGAFQGSLAGGGSYDAFIVKIAAATAVQQDFYLHASGSTLFLDGSAPTASIAKFKDSASIKLAAGNPWTHIGTWNAAPSGTAEELSALSDLHVWVGLKNSDDIGTRFDLRAEVLKNGSPVASGETYCITGVTRNPNLAMEVITAFGSFAPTLIAGTDVVSLKVLARIGTTGGVFCGGHSNAVGLRLYFDAVNRPSRFDATFVD